MTHERIIIIGSGPAGLTAAIYTSRAMLNPLVIEGTQPGGQLMITTDIENFPGYPEGIMGPELMARMHQQAERFGARFRMEMVTASRLTETPSVILLGEEEISADAIIIATGASARYLGLPSETKWRGRGVSACATCDGFFFRDKEIVVVGGGDTAVEEACYLTRFARKVTLIHRRDELRASKIMQRRVFDNEKIDVLWDTIVVEVLGEEPKGVTGVRIQNVKSKEISDFLCDGMFLAIGHEPSTQFVRGQLNLDDSGYIVVEPGSTSTGIPGVYAAGDCQDSIYRQAVSAAGTGCMAAIEAERYLHTLTT